MNKRKVITTWEVKQAVVTKIAELAVKGWLKEMGPVVVSEQ